MVHKMKKKLIWIILSIALIILILFGFFAYKEISDYTNIINLNRWIQIPKEANVEEIYSKDSWESFHGDGIRYHVYVYENEEIVNSMLDWNDEKDTTEPTAFHGSYSEALLAWIEELNMSDEDLEQYFYKIDSSNFLYRKKEDNSEIFIIQSASEKRLYILESFL